MQNKVIKIVGVNSRSGRERTLERNSLTFQTFIPRTILYCRAGFILEPILKYSSIEIARLRVLIDLPQVRLIKNEKKRYDHS